MKRKILWLFFLMFLLVGCNKTTEVVTTTGGSINTQEEMGLIELRVFDGNIQWKYDFENTWTDLVALSTLTGPTGEDGKAVMFRLNEGYIQWQREGDSTWTSLFDIASLQGLGIESMLINELGELVVTYTDDSISNLGELNKLNIIQFVDGYGRVVAVHLVKDGGSAFPPILPPMPGHTFLGWNASYNNIMVDTSVYALYSVNSYNITFNANGGDDVEEMVLEYGEAIVLPIPSRFGYCFMGWFMGDTANSPKATDGMLLRNDLTLYARWQKETAVTVTNEEELRSAIADYSVEEIIFANDITVKQNIFISHSLKIDGNNHKLLSENFYELFIITEGSGGFSSEYSPPSGGSLEILNLEIICDTGIVGFEPYSAFLFEQVYNMDVRFNNISVKGFAEEGVTFIESGDIDFTLVDSFFDVTYSGIGGYMNEGMNFYIINSTFRANVGIYIGEYSYSNFIITDSDFYIESLDEEGGAAIADFASAYNVYRFTNSNFYIEGDYISSITRSMFESDMQTFTFEDCYFETNNPYYEDLFYHEWLTDYWMHNNTLAFKEGITNLDDSSYANNSSAKIILPESLETIGNNAFSNNTNLISIVIPEGVISIGDYAFSSCYMLTSVIIPQSVTYIGDDAFVDSLATIFITSGTDTSMYDSNWDGDLGVMGIVDSGKVDGLTYVVYEEYGELNAIIIDFDGEEEDVVIPKTIDVESVPANVKAIHEYAFANQSNLKSIYIPNTVETIGYGAFNYAYNLKSVEFEANSSLSYIGDEAFIYCEGLESIFIPASVTYLGESAFGYNYDMSEIVFEEGINLVTIGVNAFSSNYYVEAVVIPASVQVIADGAFASNYRLSSLTFEEGSLLTTIGSFAFGNIYALTEVHLPATLTSLGSHAFYDNMNLVTVDFGVDSMLTTIGSSAFANDYNLQNIVLPSALITIGNDIFRDCQGLTTINIPASVLTMGNGFCFNCDNLSSVVFEEGSQLQSIGATAFYSNDSLTSIVLPDSLVSLGDSIFSQSKNLVEVNIPALITTIPNNTFSNCESLATVTFADPYNITTIGQYAFSYCLSLETIFIADTVINMGVNVFNNCPLLTISVEHVSIPPTWNTGWLGNMTATVIWAVNHRTMTIEFDNGDPNLVIFDKIGTPIPQPDDPVKVDYTFVGWFIFDGVDWVPYTFTNVPEEDVTVRALWILN